MMISDIGDASANHVRIVLPVPPKQLSPNGRYHWAAKAKAAKRYRYESGVAALVVMNNAGVEPPEWTRATAEVSFWFKTAARRDEDNAMASAKAAFDGLADAHVILNDSGLSPRLVLMSVDAKNPRVEIVVKKRSPTENTTP